MFISIYLCLYRTSFRKCPRVLIYWTALILLSVIQFRECYHVQIFGTALILHLQWAMTSMWMLLMTQDMTTTVLVQLCQAESAIYSYSELSYVSAKL